MLDDLPPAVEQHSGMEVVQSGIVGVLVKGIKERDGKAGKEQELEAGAGALAKCLGPVAGMFEEREWLITYNAMFTMPLRNIVKQLSLNVIKRLLASEALQLQLENEIYALV